MLDRGSEPCIFEFMKRNQVKLLIIFTALSAGTLLISNLSAVKLWDLAGIAVDGGLILFPLSYILGDLIVEFYGKEISRTVILSGFAINLIAALVFWIVIALPPYDGWNLQEAYAAVLGYSPRIILGSLAGYLTSNLLNNHLFVRMKKSDTVFGAASLPELWDHLLLPTFWIPWCSRPLPFSASCRLMNFWPRPYLPIYWEWDWKSSSPR